MRRHIWTDTPNLHRVWYWYTPKTLDEALDRDGEELGRNADQLAAGDEVQIRAEYPLKVIDATVVVTAIERVENQPIRVRYALKYVPIGIGHDLHRAPPGVDIATRRMLDAGERLVNAPAVRPADEVAPPVSLQPGTTPPPGAIPPKDDDDAPPAAAAAPAPVPAAAPKQATAGRR